MVEDHFGCKILMKSSLNYSYAKEVIIIEQEILTKIKQIIPHERIFLDLSDRYSYSYDASFGQYLPEIVVQPLNSDRD